MFCALPPGTGQNQLVVANFNNDPLGLLVSAPKYLVSYAPATILNVTADVCNDNVDTTTLLENCPRSGGGGTIT